MNIEVSCEIEHPVDKIFSVLTSCNIVWWNMPFLTDPDSHNIVLEPRLGGKLIERWGDQREREGSVIASVTTFRIPNLIILEGRFNLPFDSYSIVEIELETEGLNTLIKVNHSVNVTENIKELEIAFELAWRYFVHRLKAILDCGNSSMEALLESGEFPELKEELLNKLEDPHMMVEQAYQDLQQSLIQVRQATAQAIATEKHIEQQIDKNKDQADTWKDRAAMAKQQKNPDLEEQALMRQKQYLEASESFREELKTGIKTTNDLRKRLTELENEVQKMQTKKQQLIARDKAASAALSAETTLAKIDTKSGDSILDKLEARVLEKEKEVEEQKKKNKSKNSKNKSERKPE